MKRLALAAAVLVAGAIALPAAIRFAASPATAQAGSSPASPELIAKGRYLATAADCVACHTVAGGKPFAGGLPFKLPFGTMYSTNITADRATGIGEYSDEDFVRALQKGVRHDGKHLYPSMPYSSYTGMSREDAVAIKAFLFNLPTVNAPGKAPTFGFPFNQRWTLALWDAVFLHDKRFQPDPKLTAQQNRGAYLATALGHCGECHTPRNLAFAQSGSQFAGAELQGWRAFNITLNKDAGLGGWTDHALADYLSTGRAGGHGAANGPMAEAVSNSLQYLTHEDIDALVAYLKTVEARPGSPSTPTDPPPALLGSSTALGPGNGEAQSGLGRRIFEGACAGCHAWDGGARASRYTPLAGTRAVSDPTAMNVIQAVLKGADQPIGGERVYMPAFEHGFSDVEVAAVANYVVGRFGGVAASATPDAVRKARALR